MALPRAVREIGENAEMMAAQAGMKGAPATEQPAKSAETAKVEQIKPAPANDEGIPSPDFSKEHVNQDDWKERFARYRQSSEKTIGELRQENNSLSQQISALQATVTSLQTQMSQQPAKPAEPAKSQKQTEEEGFQAWLETMGDDFKEEYTEEFQRHMYKATAAARANVNSGANPDLETKINGLEQRLAKTDAERFYDALDAEYPDDGWVKSENDPEWAKFCSKRVSPIDNRTFGQVVAAATKAYDEQTLIWVLKQYDAGIKSEQQQKGGRNPLDSMLTPEGGTSSNSPVDDLNVQSETYTVSQVNKFYKDAALGHYSPEQFAKIDAQITQAGKAGKIVQG